MKLTLKSRKQGNLAFIETEVLGAKVTLSKALVDVLKKEGKLKQEIETDDRMILAPIAKLNNGKTWVNLYLTLRKDKAEQADDAIGDLPF